MKIKTILKAKKISFICLIAILVVAVINISINCIALYSNPATSFPWWSAIFFTGILYVIPILIVLGAFLYFLIKSRK